ncbi:MAG: hypothetical protein HQ519_09075 [Planctomycetes bacterium]|nr:hypothetical protein [Planctomycetota bacterium]
MNEAWIHVYSGSFSSVLANQASLEASGIHTLIQGQTTEAVVPFVTGTTSTNAELLVQHTDVELAHQILESTDSSNPAIGEGNPFHDPTVRKVLRIIGFLLFLLFLLLLFTPNY